MKTKSNMPPAKTQQVVKNPARKFNAMMGRREPYQPEYMRLGLDPVVTENNNNADFQYAHMKRQNMIGKKQQEEKRKPQLNIPKQVMVNSGTNHEHTWHPITPRYEEETLPQKSTPQWEVSDMKQLEDEENDASFGSIRYNEIPDPPNQEASPSSKEELLSLEDVAPEEYCVIVDNKILLSTDDLETIESFIDYLLFDSRCPLQDVSAESIFVFKRLVLKTGIIIKE